MARIVGVEIPGEKRIDIALRYIYGIGPANAKIILDKAKIDPSIRAKNLDENQLSQIVHAIQDGKYTHTEIPDPKLGARKLDIARMYNTKRYRPHYAGKLGSPLLLTSVIS